MLGEILMILSLSLVAALAWYPCCCTYDPPPCTVCTADSATVSVSLSGMVVDYCANCVSLDATYVLTRTGTNACTWRTSRFLSGCTGSPFFYGTWLTLTLQAMVLSPGTNQGWQLTVKTSSGYFSEPVLAGLNTAVYRWNSGSAADFDCTMTRSLTLYTYSPDPTNNPCDTSTLTVTVNP